MKKENLKQFVIVRAKDLDNKLGYNLIDIGTIKDYVVTQASTCRRLVGNISTEAVDFGEIVAEFDSLDEFNQYLSKIINVWKVFYEKIEHMPGDFWNGVSEWMGPTSAFSNEDMKLFDEAVEVSKCLF